MTAEEKAKSIIQKMKKIGLLMGEHDDMDMVKDGAIVVCDEVISELNDIVFNYDFENTPAHAHPSHTVIPFWHKVKKHIEDNY